MFKTSYWLGIQVTMTTISFEAKQNFQHFL
jgi:hypothetical protein